MDGLDTIPDDVLQRNIADLLNPQEIANLASCNSHLRSTLPNPPLRIRIRNDDAILDHTLFVSEFPSGRILSNVESLRLGQRYRFWKFDAARGHRCDMISHLPLEEGRGFDLAFAAWQRTKYDRCHRRTWMVERNCNNHYEGDTVRWGSNIELVVEGDAQFPAFACHAPKRYLSTLNTMKGVEEEDGEDGETAKEVGWCVLDSPNHKKFSIVRKDDYDKTNKKDDNLTKIQLKTRAASVFQVKDGAFAFYSSRSLEGGTLDFGREKVIVFFDLWTNQGMLHMKTAQLSFELVVPMMRQSTHAPEYRFLRKEHPLMETLWNIDKRYMNPIRTYLATAANSLLWEGGHPDQTLERFSQLDIIAKKGCCSDEGNQFILSEESPKATNLPLQKPEFANMMPERGENVFFCIFTKPCF